MSRQKQDGRRCVPRTRAHGESEARRAPSDTGSLQWRRPSWRIPPVGGASVASFVTIYTTRNSVTKDFINYLYIKLLLTCFVTIYMARNGVTKHLINYLYWNLLSTRFVTIYIKRCNILTSCFLGRPWDAPTKRVNFKFLVYTEDTLICTCMQN